LGFRLSARKYGFSVIPVHSPLEWTAPADTSKNRASRLRIFCKKLETVPPFPKNHPKQAKNRLQENAVFAQGGFYSSPSTSKSYPHIHGPKPSDCGARDAGRRWGAKRGCGYVGNSGVLPTVVFCDRETLDGGQNGILSKSCRSSFTPPDPKEPLNTLLLRGIFRAYCGLCVFLFHIGAPAWVVNSVPLLIPSALRRAAARVYLDGHLKNNAGGQP
jgi:hypothetical protein